jgi:hypothetical protein
MDEQRIRIVLTAPRYANAAADITRRITAELMRGAVNSRYAQGMSAAESRNWARFLDVLDAEQQQDGAALPDALEVSFDDWKWFWRVYNDDALRLPPQFARWRLDLMDYFEALNDEVKAARKTPAAQAEE